MNKKRKRCAIAILILANVGLLFSILETCGLSFWDPQWTQLLNELCYVDISICVYHMHILKKDTATSL